MPAALVKSLAEGNDISTEDAEKLWKQAKAITTEEKGLTESDGDAFWQYVTGVFKKSMGLEAVMESATAEEIHTAAHEAQTSHLNDLPQPTEAQIKAGNYKKGKIRLHGLEISIENPKGSTRSGVDPNGKAWEVTMPYHYGYFNRTLAVDGDHVDCLIGDHPESELVFFVDQVDAETRKYDEPKVVLGTRNLKEARELYVSGFSDGKGAKRLGAITPMHVSGFKKWLEGDTTKPLSEAVLESAGDWRTMLLAADSFDAIRGAFAAKWPGLFAGISPDNEINRLTNNQNGAIGQVSNTEGDTMTKIGKDGLGAKTEVEVSRSNVTVAEFFAAIKAACAKKGLSFDLERETFENPAHPSNDTYTVKDGIKYARYGKGEPTREYDGTDAAAKAETSRIQPYDYQVYVLNHDGSMFNEICEFTFDDGKRGHGYYYQGNRDATEQPAPEQAKPEQKLRDMVPREFFNEYMETPAAKLLDVDVVEKMEGGWPGAHQNVNVWWRLANDKAVGWNENPGKGWSFPVINDLDAKLKERDQSLKAWDKSFMRKGAPTPSTARMIDALLRSGFDRSSFKVKNPANSRGEYDGSKVYGLTSKPIVERTEALLRNGLNVVWYAVEGRETVTADISSGNEWHSAEAHLPESGKPGKLTIIDVKKFDAREPGHTQTFGPDEMDKARALVQAIQRPAPEKSKGWTEPELQEFHRWYDSFDLGYLEPVRGLVDQYALDNASDVQGDRVAAARATVRGYVDDEDFGRELFGQSLPPKTPPVPAVPKNPKTGPQRVAVLRSMAADIPGLQEYLDKMDAVTTHKELRALDNQNADIIPILREPESREIKIGDMGLYWVLYDLKQMKEREINKRLKDEAQAAKVKKETEKTEKKEREDLQLKRYKARPELKKVLDLISADFRVEIIESITDRYKRLVEQYFTGGKFNLERPDRKAGEWVYAAYQRTLQELRPLFAPTGKMDEYTLRPDWSGVVDKIAKESADYWIAVFENKTAWKLGEVLERKAGGDVSLAGNVREHAIRMAFPDGSGFTMRTQQVWARSTKGNDFVRYPTTFHNVIFADKSRMSTPSAEKMQKEFGITEDSKTPEEAPEPRQTEPVTTGEGIDSRIGKLTRDGGTVYYANVNGSLVEGSLREVEAALGLPMSDKARREAEQDEEEDGADPFGNYVDETLGRGKYLYRVTVTPKLTVYSGNHTDGEHTVDVKADTKAEAIQTVRRTRRDEDGRLGVTATYSAERID